MGLDSAQFQSGVTRASTSTKRLQGDIQALDGASRSFQLRAVSQQFSQVAQSAMATGDPIRSLAIQLPDIAGIMGGPLTIAAGVAVGALLPLAASFLGAGEDAQTAEGALGDFNAALDDVGRYIDIAKTPLAELREEYGALAETVQEAARRMVGIRVEDALGGVSEILDPLTGDIERAVGLMDQLAQQSATISQLEAVPFAQRDLEALQSAQDTLSVINSDLTGLQSQLGLTAGEAERLGEGFEAMEDARSLDELTTAAAGLLSWIDQTYDSTERLPALLSSIYPYLNDIAASGARVAEEAHGAGLEMEGIAGASADANARLLEMAQVDLARAFSDAETPLETLLGLLREGKGLLGGWGSALGDFVAGFAPSEAGYIGQIGTQQGDNMERLVRSATIVAEQLGVAVEDLLTVISYETGGTFRTDIVNPTGHTGLIQFSQYNLEKYAISAGSTVEEQMVAAGNYLKDAGIQAGDSLLRIYAAINAGDPDLIHASDEANGGAPGTVLDKVNDQMDGHMANAAALLSAFGGTVQETAETFREAEDATEKAAREAQQEADRLAREAESIAKRELGYREDLIAASQQATQDAQFELSLAGQSADFIAQERAEYILLNQAREAGIDLNERIAGSTETYGQMIERTSIAVGQAAAEQEKLAAAQDLAAQSAAAAAEAQAKAAAEMQGFVSSVTGMALGPITSNPIGQFASTLPGFNAGAESVIGGFMSSGFTGATTALSTALGGATTGLAGLGTALGAIAGPVGLAIGLFNGIRGTTETLDEGLRVMLDGLDQAVVQTYETVKKTRFFGLSVSTSTGYDAADASISDPISKAYAELGAGILDLSRTLGKGRKDFADFSMSFQLSLEGMTDEEKVRAVEAEFGRVSDRLARMAGVTQGMIEPSETATQALERLVATFDVVNAGFDQLDMAQLKTGESSVKLAAKMAEAAGGMDALASAFDFYATNFLSVSEQASEAQEAFTEGLNAANINAPISTMEQFTAEVERLEAVGNEVKLASLVSLADEFIAWQDKLTEAQATATAEAEEAAQAAEALADQRYDLETQILELQGNVTALRERELAQLDPTLHALQEMVWGLEDAQAAMEALDPEAFATEFLYLQAKAKAANQPYAPGSNVVALPTAEAAAAEAAQAQADATLAELKALRAVVETMSAALQTNTRNTVTELRVISEIVDEDGLLTRTA